MFLFPTLFIASTAVFSMCFTNCSIMINPIIVTIMFAIAFIAIVNLALSPILCIKYANTETITIPTIMSFTRGYIRASMSYNIQSVEASK